MLYNINGKYYVLVGRKYIRVLTDVKDDEVILTPKQDEYIEKTDDVKAVVQPFDNKFQNLIKNRSKKVEKPVEVKKEREDVEVRTNNNRRRRNR